MPVKCQGYACKCPSSTLEPFEYEVRDVRDNDVLIDIKFCGLCHTDLHMMQNDWKISQYPIVPGHEVAGVVAQVGSKCTKFKVGDHVGVGYIAWSCRECEYCKAKKEQFCPKFVQSYGFAMPDGEITRGGFSNKMVVPEEFAVKIPSQFPLNSAAPLLCAGITVWSPMVHGGLLKEKKNVGVVGLGGLGHMAVKLAAAMGHKVTVISSSSRKVALAKELGATEFVDASQPEQIKKATNTLNFIINTVAVEQDIDMLLSLLVADGILCGVGLPEASIKYKFSPANIVFGRKSIMGSIVGSVAEQDIMMEFCTKHNVLPMIEVLPIKDINLALDRLNKNDVKFRFVLDVSQILFDLQNTATDAATDADIILIDDDEKVQLTVSDFRRICRDIRIILRDLTVKCYAVLAPNTALIPCVFLAIADDSGVTCLLNPSLGDSDMEFAMRDMGVEVLVLTDRNSGKSAQAVAREMSIPIVEITFKDKHTKTIAGSLCSPGTDSWKPMLFRTPYPADEPPAGNDRILKLHTSGTTSKPKTVATSHANATASCLNQINTYQWTQGDVGLLAMPLFHVHGLFNGCLGPMAAGARVIIPERRSFHKQEFWAAAKKHRPTFVTAVPTIWQILINCIAEDASLKSTLSNLRYVRACSSGLPIHLAKRMAEVLKIPILEAYAMTEASHQMCSNRLDSQKLGTVGYPTGTEVAIISEEGEIVPMGEHGEICVRGPNVIDEYLNLAPELNAKNFHNPKLVETKTKNTGRPQSFHSTAAPPPKIGADFDAIKKWFAEYFDRPVLGELQASRIPKKIWLRTGDRGFMLSCGAIQIEGRLKEMINRGGEKISPIEVEEIALKLESVEEVACFGLPDEVLGEIVAVAVCPTKPDADEISLAREIRSSFKQVAAFKTPARIYFCPNGLPKGPTGKVQRSLLKDKLNLYRFF